MEQNLIAGRLDGYIREQADRPFGDAELASGRTLMPFSRALMAAADNLLAKADRAMTDGDPARARRFLERAAALDFDDHEQTAPGAYAASMLMFDALTDALEDSALDDARWLEAAVETLAAVEGWGRSELRHSLCAIRQDYDLHPDEVRAITRAVAIVPPQEELLDATLPHDEFVAAMTSVLETAGLYRTALGRSGG